METNYHDQQILLASALRGSATVKLARDHQSGLLLIVDVTDVGAGPGTIRPKLTLRSQIVPTHVCTLWNAASVINAAGTYVYHFAPQGSETLAPVLGLTERVALPLPNVVDFQTIVAVNNCTYSVDVAGLAL